ncbi:MAG: OmpP1/FadL family transporter [Bdellovibrionales bacterium]
MKDHRKFVPRVVSAATLSSLTVLSTLLAHISLPAHASGYEKSIIWGGRSSGVGGIATPYVTGAEALYFNPAGLVSDRTGQEVALDVSPTWSQFKGPVNNQNDIEESERTLSTPFGLIYSATLNEKIGFGFGGYVSGGAVAKYEDVSFAGLAGTADVETNLIVTELSAGVGYKLLDNLKLGLAWRVSMADAKFSFVKRGAGGSVTNLTVSELQDTNFTGFKLGAQWDVSEATKVGFTYRSKVKFLAEGNAEGNLLTTSVTPLAEHTVDAATQFPMAAALGAQHDLNADWRILGEYVWTNYSEVDSITLTDKTPAGAFNYSSKIQQDWKDQHNIRLGGEYLALTWPIRFGYVWTSQVTSDDYARAAFTPPGMAHTFTAGTGTDFGESFRFDAGIEYTMVEGEGTGAAAGNTSEDIRAGTYEAEAYAVHLGLNYYF